MAQEQKPQLSIMDGLRFGCGFYIAAFIFSIAMVILAFILMLIFGAIMGGGLEDLLRQGF